MKRLHVTRAGLPLFFVLFLAFSPCAWSQAVDLERSMIEANIRGLGPVLWRLEGAVLQRLNEIKTKNESLKANHLELQIRVQQARIAFEEARLAREVADVAVKEYEEGIAPRDMETAEAEIRLATEALKRDKASIKEREALVDLLEKAPKNDVLVSVQLFEQRKSLATERLFEQRDKYSLEQAQVKKEVLVKYTKSKRQQELMAELEKAKAATMAEKAVWAMETFRLEEAKREASHPLALTDAEKKALVQVQAASEAWKKLRGQFEVYKKDPTAAKFEALKPLFNEVSTVIYTAPHSWHEAQEARLEENDAELQKQLESLGIKPAG